MEDGIHGDDLVLIDYGIALYLAEVGTVVGPFFLAAVESWAGFPRLGIVFVAFVGTGLFTLLRLVINNKKLQ